ncbi:hypothetical protein V6Z11_D13G263200 [Gossypium hirsutum]
MQRINNKKGGYIKLERVEKFILLVGSFERLELHERKMMKLRALTWILPWTNTKELKEKLKENLRNKSDFLKNGTIRDQVRLGVARWKKRYYKLKFSADRISKKSTLLSMHVQKYTEGLLWVLLYYFLGVPSWAWYYPYYYAPFSSDMKGLSQVSVKF